MIKITFGLVLTLLVVINTNAQEMSACEKELESGKIKIINPDNDQWYEKGKSYLHGTFSNKTITFCCEVDSSTKRAYPITYTIERWDDKGVYFFYRNNHEYQYKTEKDAAYAIYCYNRCNVVLEKGKIAVVRE